MLAGNQPIIVGGCYRSGTSLVRRLLNAHSRINCGPEVKFFRDFYADYFCDPVKHLRFTTSARTLLPESELLQILGQAFIAMQERAAERADKPRWADKNPENVLYLNQWQALLGNNWALVHVVRNPLDTLASMKEHPFPHTLPADLEDRIEVYLRYNEAALDFEECHSDRYYRVRYEHLVSSPEQALPALMTWLNERFEPQQLSFNEAPRQDGLEDPKIGMTSAIHNNSVGRWKTVLANVEIETILRETTASWLRLDQENPTQPG